MAGSGHEHDVRFLPRLPLSSRNHQLSGLVVSLLQPEPAEDGHHETSLSHRATPGSDGGRTRLRSDAECEGYHLLAALLTNAAQAPTRAYVKIEYEAPRESEKF
jgi:hypothetical protein